MKGLVRFAALIACLASGALAAQDNFETAETALQWEAVEREGAEYRRMYSEAISALETGNASLARDNLERVIHFCESKKSSDAVRVVSFASPAEFTEYLVTIGESDGIAWVDMVCPASLKMRAFIHANVAEYEEALDRLEAATQIAPFWAEPHTEIGYIQSQLRKFEAARAAYEKARELAEAHESSAYVKPMALRGIGFVLIELGELGGAQQAFEESLLLDPGNEIATSELRYIEGLRKRSD